MTEVFDARLCEEKHKYIDRRLSYVEGSMEKLSAKFDKIRTLLIASLTALCLNFLGVGALLLMQIAR